MGIVTHTCFEDLIYLKLLAKNLPHCRLKINSTITIIVLTLTGYIAPSFAFSVLAWMVSPFSLTEVLVFLPVFITSPYPGWRIIQCKIFSLLTSLIYPLPWDLDRTNSSSRRFLEKVLTLRFIFAYWLLFYAHLLHSSGAI